MSLNTDKLNALQRPSDTPETDAAESSVYQIPIEGWPDFARKLERERNEAVAKHDATVEALIEVTQKLEIHEMKEKCTQCGFSWNPSWVESGWCINCILKERTKERDELRLKLAQANLDICEIRRQCRQEENEFEAEPAENKPAPSKSPGRS